VTATVPHDVTNPSEQRSPIMLDDEEIFASHVGAKLSGAVDAGAHPITDDMKRAAAAAGA
jgi:hypothetical protein